MGRLMAVGVLNAVCSAVHVGRANLGADVCLKEYPWFDRAYITRITIGCLVTDVKTVIHSTGEVLVTDRTNYGTRCIYTAGGKARCLVIALSNDPIHDFEVFTSDNAVGTLEFIRMWASLRLDPEFDGSIKIDDGLENLLTVLCRKSGVLNLRGTPIPNQLLAQPDVVALLSPE